MNPSLKFTIGAHAKTNLKITVFVWRTYKQLQAERLKIPPLRPPLRNPCVGFCHRSNNRHNSELTISEIHLCVGPHLSIETIAHEAFHAAVGYVEWVRPYDCRDDSLETLILTPAVEETIAESTGYITEGIVWNLRREKLKIKSLDQK